MAAAARTANEAAHHAPARILEQNLGEDPNIEPVNLAQGEPVVVDAETNHIGFWGPVKIIAEVELGSVDNAVAILDVEDVLPKYDGYRYPFGESGPRVSSDAKYIAVNRPGVKDKLGGDHAPFVDSQVLEIGIGKGVVLDSASFEYMEPDLVSAAGHAILSVDIDGYLHVEDLGSRYGTAILANRVNLEAAHDPEARRRDRATAYMAHTARLAYEASQTQVAENRDRESRRQSEDEAAAKRKDAEAAQEAYLEHQEYLYQKSLTERRIAQAKSNRQARLRRKAQIRAEEDNIPAEKALEIIEDEHLARVEGAQAYMEDTGAGADVVESVVRVVEDNDQLDDIPVQDISTFVSSVFKDRDEGISDQDIRKAMMRRTKFGLDSSSGEHFDRLAGSLYDNLNDKFLIEPTKKKQRKSHGRRDFVIVA